MPNGKELRGRGTLRVLGTLVLLCAAGALFACSSGDGGGDPSPPPPSSVRSEADTTPDQPTDQTATVETDEEREERRRQEREKGGFSRAGRLSDGFDGYWPSYRKEVINTSTDTYVGAVSAVDCTPGDPPTPADPPSRTVSVASGGSQWAEFSFSSVEATSSPRHICVTLSDDGGETGTDTDVMSAYIPPSPEPQQDASPPDPGTPTPTPDEASPGGTEQ
ncbi:hypothetical protein [Streptomyces yangpuensis]|uniref:hypothetical protein n=1 Tax=Streptomyces yangpuensis TaxID=1648182 RepID=UPI003715F13C